MEVAPRDFHWANDFELVRSFLIDSNEKAGCFLNWIPSMFENIRFGPCGPIYSDDEDEYIKIWEAQDGNHSVVAGVTCLKPSGSAWIQIHQEYRELEDAMIPWLERQWMELHENRSGVNKLEFEVPESNTERIACLQRHGYDRGEVYSHYRIRPVNLHIPEFHLPESYSVRNARIEQEFSKYKEVQGSVFPHCAKHMTISHARIYRSASFYNEELDIVAVAPNGDFAAFCTVRLDPISRIAELEPVGTHPEHRKLGLAKAVICEGLRRLRNHNPKAICILGAAPTEGAVRLYDSLGFSKEDVYLWSKTLR